MRWTPLVDKPAEAQTPPEYWAYFDSLPANVRGALNDAPNQDMFMALYKVVLDKFPWNPQTGKWVGAK